MYSTRCIAYLPRTGYYTTSIMFAMCRFECYPVDAFPPCLLPRYCVFFTLHLDWDDFHEPSALHVCDTLCRGSSYAVTASTLPGNVDALLQPRVIFYLPTIAIHRTPHSPHIYVSLWNVVTYYNTVFTSDSLLAIVFALLLWYFTGLNYTVQSSHSLVLCPQSSTLCIDSSSACNDLSSSSASLPSLVSTHISWHYRFAGQASRVQS